MSKFILLLKVVWLSLFVTFSSAQQELIAVRSNSSLPTRRYYVSALYDGDDTIYLFGGYPLHNPNVSTEILKYSVSLDTIELAGHMPVNSSNDRTVMDSNKNIYHIVAKNTLVNREIFQFFPESRNFEHVASILPNIQFGCIQPHPDTALLFGGYPNRFDVRKLNLTNLQSTVIARLPDPGSYVMSGCWVNEKKVGYLFDGQNAKVYKYDDTNHQIDTLPTYMPRAPSEFGTIFDGRHCYLVGVYNYTDLQPGNVLQFDPTTETMNVIPVGGDEEWTTRMIFYTTGTVYVEKLNRIYTFGGFANNGQGATDGIWYFDLDSMNPPTTTTTPTPLPTLDPEEFDCSGKPDLSLHAYPGDCEKFINCRGGHAYAFACPEPLLFDAAVYFRCVFPDVANCQDAKDY